MPLFCSETTPPEHGFDSSMKPWQSLADVAGSGDWRNVAAGNHAVTKGSDRIAVGRNTLRAARGKEENAKDDHRQKNETFFHRKYLQVF